MPSSGEAKVAILSGDPADIEFVASTLKKGGFDVLVPQDAAEALLLAVREDLDVIILDLRSQAPAGSALLERITAGRHPAPVLAITTTELMSDSLAQQGIAGVLVKPLQRDRLLSHVQAVLEGSSQGSEQEKRAPGADEPTPKEPQSTPAAGPKPLILVVDDEPDMQMLLTSLLAHNGFDVETAGNGMEGLKSVQQRRPNAILLDIMLPKLDGFQMCRLIKFNEKFRDIPVIMLTARNHPKDRELAEASGANDFIVKPFDAKNLIERLKHVTQ